jgi:drug/metabolite transporter (DMT)-like permease
VLLAVIIWGSDYLFAKVALREISPLSFAALRTTVSAAILVPLFMKREKDLSVSAKDFLWLLGLALLGTCMNRICYSIGLRLTTASKAAVLLASSPIFALMASYLSFRSEVAVPAALGIVISFLGVYLVIQKDWKEWAVSPEIFQGDLILIVGAISWALFTVLIKGLSKRHSTLKVTTYMMLIGTILMAPFLPPKQSGGWFEVSKLAWLCVLYVGILGNCVGFFLWVKGVQDIGPLRTVLYQYLIPVTAILFAIPFLHERMTPLQICGSIVAFGGIFIARFDRR